MSYSTYRWNGHESFQCSLCPKDFLDNEPAMIAHMKDAHPAEQRPLISCLLVSNRPAFLPQAIRQFMEQSWPNKELVVVADEVDLQFADFPGVRLFPVEPGLSIGAKRNMAAASARGTILTHWDDDEVYHPRRIETWAKELLASGASLGGVLKHYYLDPVGNCWQYSSKSPFLHGATLMYRREVWWESHFQERNIGEDASFVRAFAGNDFMADPRVIEFTDPEMQAALIHAENTCPKKIDAEEFLEVASPFPGQSLRIALAMLTWNTADLSLESFAALLLEAERLKLCGYSPSVIVLDNGSTDGTYFQLKRLLNGFPFPVSILHNGENLGNSIGRRQLIQEAEGQGADFILFTDGDLELIPFSTFPLVAQLNWRTNLGCAGLFSGGDTAERKKADAIFPGLLNLREDKDQPVAWTQYGLFRMEMFAQGVHFEEEGPFGGPGWGFEDNDLWLQMVAAGWENTCFHGATYLHRRRSSSISNLKAEGKSPRDLYELRRQFLREKWGNDPIMKNRAAKITATELRDKEPTK